MKNTRFAPERLLAIDMLRGLAVILMFTTHLYRLQWRSGATSTEWPLGLAALNFMMEIEPLTSGLFLFLVGFSLVLSKEYHTGSARDWCAQLSVRAAVLTGLSSLIFIAQFGPQWPDCLFAPGILTSIAVSILTVGIPLAFPRPLLFQAGLAAFILAGTAALEQNEISISGINAGNAEIFPMIFFAIQGALAGLAYQKASFRGLLYATGTCSALGAIGLIVEGSSIINRNSVYKRFGQHSSTAIDWVRGLASSEGFGEISLPYWHHTLYGALRVCFVLALMSCAVVYAYRRTKALRAQKILELIGRNSLAVYLAHLVLIAILDVLKWQPIHAGATWCLITLFVCGAITLSYYRERKAI